MTSPLSVISAGSFFTGLMREYSSLGCAGARVVGINSILSIRPSSIAAMLTLRDARECALLRVTVRMCLRRDDFLALFAEPLDAERDHVADIEEFRRLHAGA